MGSGGGLQWEGWGEGDQGPVVYPKRMAMVTGTPVVALQAASGL